MDADSLSARLTSASRKYKSALQSRSGGTKWDGFDPELLMGLEEIDGTEDDMREEYPCPFCFECYDIVGLCCHIDDEHPVEANNGVCPICATMVGVDMVAHITLQHGSIFKKQRKKKSHKLGSPSMLSLLRKELREKNLQYLFGGSSRSVPSNNAAPDPLLSSFIAPVSDDYGNVQTRSTESEKISVKKSTADGALERKVSQPPLSVEDQAEKTKRSQFVQGLLLSTIFDDNL